MKAIIKKVLRYVFWDKVNGTLWTCWITACISALNGIGLIYPDLALAFHVTIGVYTSTIDPALMVLGRVSFGMFIIGLVTKEIHKRRNYKNNPWGA
ncbi:MAG: hypothetical protein ACHP6H_06630 [Legionellales bacterium]